MIPLSKLISNRRIQLLGHTARLSNSRRCLNGFHLLVDGAKKVLEWVPPDGRRPRGRPKKTWRSTLKEDLRERGTNWYQALSNASDRRTWRNVVALCQPLAGGTR